MATPTVLRYPPAVLRADCLRGAAGLALTVPPLALMEVAFWVGVGLGLAGVLFAVFVLRAVVRHVWPVRLDGEGVWTEGPLGVRVRWAELRRLSLRYYATRRDRTDGWMQLTIGGARGRLTVESTLDGFDDVVERAVQAARRNRVPLSDSTVGNLLALGLDPETE